MIRTLPLAISGALLAAGLGARAAVPAAGDSHPQKPPETQAGPYRVVVDRISANRNSVLTYSARPGEAAVQAKRMAQLQLGVFTEDKSAAAGLTTLMVKGVTVESSGRQIELPSYGGPLENPNDLAIVRAYLYVPGLPLRAPEMRSLDGQIVSYDHSAALNLEIPVGEGPYPRSVDQGGVKTTLRGFQVENGTAQLQVTVEAPAPGVLVNTVNDGTYGVSLQNTDERAAAANGGVMLQPRPNVMEYRLSFGGLRGTPGKVLIRCLHRGGARHVYPFRIEHIPIPDRHAAS